MTVNPEHLELFETELTRLLLRFQLDRYTLLPANMLARKVIEYVDVVRTCEYEASLSRRQPLPIIAPSRPLHLPDGPPPEPAKIEVLPATEDWCACGWSEEPHLHTDHEPLTPPCSKFVSLPGAFVAGPNSTCQRCLGTGRAHGITTLGPPTQIVETLTPLED